MSDIRNDDEAAADPETGAGTGRPGRGTRPIDPTRPCLNCGDPTHGEYCPACGQRKAGVRVSVRALFMEVLEDQFSLDQRLPRTLGALLFKPGHLTVEHINGRIVRYIHPFRLYLVSSLLFFVLLSFISLQLVRETLERNGPRVEIGGTAADGEGAAALDKALAELRLELADTTQDAATLAELQETEAEWVERRRQLRIDSLTAVVADVTAALDRIDREAADTTLPAAVRGVLVNNRSMFERELAAASGRREAMLADTLPADSGAATVAVRGGEERPLREVFGWEDGGDPQVQVGVAAVDSVLEDQLRRIGAMEPREAADTLLGTFFNYIPTMMFILLPVFAAVLKLLYIRRRRFYAEHFVFLLHVHSMVFILAVVMLLLRGRVGMWLDTLLLGWILVYIYLAMKRVYGQGWFKTFVKYWTLGWSYFWILSMSIPLAVIATLLLF